MIKSLLKSNQETDYDKFMKEINDKIELWDKITDESILGTDGTGKGTDGTGKGMSQKDVKMLSNKIRVIEKTLDSLLEHQEVEKEISQANRSIIEIIKPRDAIVGRDAPSQVDVDVASALVMGDFNNKHIGDFIKKCL